MWVAFNKFYPPDLAHVEARNASPDRSHNETWDSLVITGLLGFMAYMAVFISIFYWALRWLGLITGKRDTILFGALLAVFALVSTVGFIWNDGGSCACSASPCPLASSSAWPSTSRSQPFSTRRRGRTALICRARC